MYVGIYSEDENRFLPEMEGADPPNVGLPLPGSWDLRTFGSWVVLHPGRGLPHVRLICLYASGLCESTIQGWFVCTDEC
jgi:hypothetical protein